MADRGLSSIADHYLTFGAFIPSILYHEYLLPGRRYICVERMLVLTLIPD